MHLSMDVSVKLRKNDIKGYVNHVFRKSSDKDLRHKNEEINPDLTKNNIDYDLSSDGYGKTFEERLNNRLKDYKSLTKTGKLRKVRSDAVLARAFVLQPSSDFFEGKTDKEKAALLDKFTRDAMPFLIDQFGRKNLLGMSGHLDETNPHLQCAFCMMTEDGRLSQKDFFSGPKQLAAMHRDFRSYMNDRGWDFEIENKHEDTKHYSDSDYKRNAKAIESARDDYTSRKRKYNEKFDDLSAEKEQLDKEKKEFEEQKKIFEENQRRENEALRARQSALKEQADKEYQEAREMAKIDVLTSFRGVLKNLYKNTPLAERITREFNIAINRSFLGFQPRGLGGAKALEEEKNQSINEQVKRANNDLDLEL